MYSQFISPILGGVLSDFLSFPIASVILGEIILAEVCDVMNLTHTGLHEVCDVMSLTHTGLHKVCDVMNLTHTGL